jgi:GNAT superfamily N-acetyltransferase
MSTLQTCSDKERLAAYLHRYPQLNYYPLGDLDDFFWPDTRWFISRQAGEIDALALLYTAEDPVVLLATLNENREPLTRLLEHMIPHLPERVYAHLNPGFEMLFSAQFALDHYGEHFRMTLTNPSALGTIDTSGVIPLSEADLPRLNTLYTAAYPGTWFSPRMLTTRQYVGLHDDQGQLLCAAGVHVYSPDYRVAALGNIATLPEHRGRGLATAAVAGLCQKLIKQVDLIGLNVRTDNPAAIHAYQKTGFEIVDIYHEWMLSRI